MERGIITKKAVLDILYPMRAQFAELAQHSSTRSFQLSENDVSGRNLAAGESRGYEQAAKKIDEVITNVLAYGE